MSYSNPIATVLYDASTSSFSAMDPCVINSLYVLIKAFEVKIIKADYALADHHQQHWILLNTQNYTTEVIMHAFTRPKWTTFNVTDQAKMCY